MATWDGSYIEMDDPNFYVNNQNRPNSSANSNIPWNYFYPSNADNSSNNHHSYDNTQPFVGYANQHQPNPSVSTNLVVNDNHNQFYFSDNASAMQQQRQQPISKNLTFFKNNYHPKHNSGRQQHRQQQSHNNRYYSYQDLAQGSNLLPTAVEFVPNQVRQNQKPHNQFNNRYKRNTTYDEQYYEVDAPEEPSKYRQNNSRNNYKKSYPRGQGNQHRYQENVVSENGVDTYQTSPRYNNWQDKRGNNYQGNRRPKSIPNSEVNSQEKDSVNWRLKTDQQSPQPKSNFQSRSTKKYKPDDAANQRERLSELLNRGQLECLVCCEHVRQNDWVWSCRNCYHVLHLKCVKKWATSSQDESGWRCPACRNIVLEIPEEYVCFCGKLKEPGWNRRDTAHSCGEVCERTKSNPNCVHKCIHLCHPGSCPPCDMMVNKSCGCGRITQTQKCQVQRLLQCEETCGRILNCEIHECEQKCHHGSCEPCDKVIVQGCYCGKNQRDVTCDSNVPPEYSCENECNKALDCENHACKETCHPGPCEPCQFTPDKITHCCCSKTAITVERKSCLDPIPTCDQVCAKRLKCGQPSNPHLCKANCHEGVCPNCDLTTKVKCRCGHMDKEILCTELKSKADDARCEKKCTKKRSCGKHKCNRMCCIDIEHVCPLPCSKTLSCGKHKCELTCHRGRCQACWRSSFDELYCECGSAVIYPPVPCGTRRPPCDKPCTREHPCEHEALHNCHSEPSCPPCTVLSKKWCYGKHELRRAVPCYVNEVSCGLACNKPLSCGRHKCLTICHPGVCAKPGQTCTQPCTTPRELCGHICAAPCHEGKCAETPCKETVKVTCQCGKRTMSRACAENDKDYQRIVSGILASKMSAVQLGQSFDLEEVFGNGNRKQNQLKTLDCNEECKIHERNQRLALGLQIVNPDLSSKLTPQYSDFMKQWGKKDPSFCQTVHEKLAELVQLAKISKQKSRSYSFDVMNRDKRQFVHEYCEHFGCDSQAYDQEPKRNIVATAVKDKCWLPSVSLMDILQRESGQRKVPGPLMNKAKLMSVETSVTSLRRGAKDV